MSSLLDQAIVDAAALKEAAIKNAESAIIEKYAPDIKKAVESLLEQDDALGLGGEAALEGEEDAIENDEITNAIPLATAPEKENDVIELDLEELSKLADKLTDDEMGQQMAHSVAEPTQVGPPPAAPVDDVSTVPVGVALEEEQDIEIDGLDELLEELVVDFVPQKSGWEATPDDIMDYKEQLKLAQLASTKSHEDMEELRSAAHRLAEERKELRATNKKLVETMRDLQQKFNKVNLSNARLLYTNRVLTNTSLNERQKLKIVESLSSAGSIEEAKMIFETLQSAVGSIHTGKQPQSLREAIQRTSAVSLRREPRESESPEVSRMQILAGIKTKH